MTQKRKLIFIYSFLILYFMFLLMNSTKLVSDVLFGQVICVFAITFASLPILDSFVRKNVLYTILFSFIFLFSYTLKYFYFDRLWISFHQIGIGSIETMNQVTTILFMFNLLLWFFLKFPNKSNMLRKPITYNNNILFIFNISVFVVMTIFGNTREYIFNSGGYAFSTQTGSRNSLTEYAIIFLAASFLFSGINKKHTLLLYIVSALYCLKNLLQGGRVETVMVLFLILIFDLAHRFTFYKLLIAAFFSFVLLTMFSYFRDNPYNLIGIEGYESMLESFIEKKSRTYISSNQGDVLYASERMIILIREQILDTYGRVISFIYYIISPFTPSKYLPAEANLATFRTDLYSVGGGGLAPVYFFVYLSYLGLILLSFVVSKAIYGYTFKKMNSFIYFYGLFVIISTPRWYVYNPIFLVKFCLIGAIYLYLLSRFQNNIQRFNFILHTAKN